VEQYEQCSPLVPDTNKDVLEHSYESRSYVLYLYRVWTYSTLIGLPGNLSRLYSPNMLCLLMK